MRDDRRCTAHRLSPRSCGAQRAGLRGNRGDASHHSDFARRWSEERQPYLLETTRPGVFAMGDVRSGSAKRVASAVGEGSMALTYIYRTLGSG